MSDQEMSGEGQSRKNPAYECYDTMTPVELIKKMKEAQDAADTIKGRLAEVTGHLDYLRLIKIPQVFEEQEIKNMKVDGVGRCQLTADIYASIKSGQKDAVFEYLRDTGRGDLITESVNASTLKAALKGMIKSAEPIPDELFNITPFSRASIVKV